MAKKKTLKSTSLPEPQSRNEALLQNILGADYDLGEPRSRNEALLMQIAEKIGQLSEPYTAGQYININNREISSTLHAGENITIDEDGAINAAGGGGGAEVFDVGVDIATNGTEITSVNVHLSGNTFKNIYDNIIEGKKVALRFFDMGGYLVGTPPKNGTFVTQIEISDGITYLPSISGIFCPSESGASTKHIVALSINPTSLRTLNNANTNMNIAVSTVHYKILS